MSTASQPGVVGLRLKKDSAEAPIVTGMVSDDILERLNGRASLLCRPDDVRVHQDTQPLDRPNMFTGTVTYSSFVGGRWHTLIKLEGMEFAPVLAYVPMQFQALQQVWLEFPPGCCQIVPE